MKPYKIFSMSMIVLLCLAITYNGILFLSDDSIAFITVESIFSFVFPAFIFFLTWQVSYKRKVNENKNNLRFYKEVLINAVLPYFLCMMPYIIYKYGINNLKFAELLKILFEGSIEKEFIYLKTTIHLLLLLPIAEYFVKLNTKRFVIISLILSVIFSALNLNEYIYTDVFNYLIYLALRRFVYILLQGSYFLFKI